MRTYRNILFVNPTGDEEVAGFGLGIAYLSSVLRRLGKTVSLLDLVNIRIGWDVEYFLRILGKSQGCLYYYHKPLACVRRHPDLISNNLVKTYIEKLKIHKQLAMDYPFLKKELGWKLNMRIAITLICLSDAYKLEKRYVNAIITALKSVIKYPPFVVFYFYCFLVLFLENMIL